MPDRATDRWTPQVDTYTICGMPDGHDLWSDFTVFVRRRWEGLWDVKWRVYQVDTEGNWDVVPREWDWTPYLMPLDQALEVATARAKAATLRGKTADEWLAAEAVQSP